MFNLPKRVNNSPETHQSFELFLFRDRVPLSLSSLLRNVPDLPAMDEMDDVVMTTTGLEWLPPVAPDDSTLGLGRILLAEEGRP